MRVLGLDAGTTTLRFHLLEGGRRRARGMVDRVGGSSVLEFRGEAGERLRRAAPVADAEAATLLALEWLRTAGCAPDVVALRAGDDPPARGAHRAALESGGGAAPVVVRESGPHALAHQDQAARGAALLERPEGRLVTLHVGARASIAVPAGGGGPEAIEAPAADLRELFHAERAGDAGAAATLAAFVERLRRALGAALAGGAVDAVVLGGGAAEGSPVLRERLTAGLLPLDAGLNARSIGRDVRLSPAGARPALLVVRADVAALVARLTDEKGSGPAAGPDPF
jgi:uncharacterized protein YndB with AHSA1/START domain